jgi:hypothetical protein
VVWRFGPNGCNGIVLQICDDTYFFEKSKKKCKNEKKSKNRLKGENKLRRPWERPAQQ